MPPSSHPMFLTFDTKVALTVLSGFLPAAGTLLCDPVAKVTEVTRRTFSNHRGAVAGESSHVNVFVDHEERVIGSTKQRIFTAHPNFDETIKFVCPSLDRRDGTARRAAQIAASGGVAPDDAHASSTLVSTERYLVITVEDSSANFLGFAKCEFPLDRPSTGAERLMLVPRYLDEHDHPSRIEDIKTLDRFGIDDFGFLNIEWNVTMIPVGGAVLSSAADVLRAPLPPPPLPVGLVVKASWIPSSAAGNSVIDRSGAAAPTTGADVSRRTPSHISFQMSVMFDSGASDTTDQFSNTTFRLENNTPLFVGLSKVELLETATFLCRVQKGQHGSTVTSKLVLPIQPFFPEAIERDISYCAPLYANGVIEQQGILVVSIRALAKPIEGPLPACRESQAQHSCPRVNDPKHQAVAAHPNQLDWGRPMPNCPIGAYQPIVWESESHIARSTERRWKQECVLHSRPTNDHVRHIFEALLGRVALDLNIAQLASSFFNKAANTLTTSDLQQLLAAVVFHADGLSLQDAIRFGFVMIRRESERAIKIADVVFVLEHSLFGRTVDMPAAEIERRVTDILGAAQPADRFITFDEYNAFIVQHAALWFELGASLMFSVTSERWEQTAVFQDNGSSSFNGQRQQQQSALAANLGATSASTSATAAVNTSTTNFASASTGAQKTAQPIPAGGDNPENWRTFTVRVIKTGRAFSVTSHINDTIVDVMQMVEESSTIPATRQKWIYHGLQVDSRRKVGDVFTAAAGAGGKQPEVSVQEKEEMLKLIVVYREKNKKWEQEFLATEKVLRLRAFAQHKTMIPLSRCAMTSCGVVMQDRHCLDHYKLVDGSIIEITQQ